MANHDSKGVVAYGLTPYAGGTTIVYHLLARGLRTLGWKIFSIAVGKRAAQGYDPDFGDESSVILAPEETSLSSQVEAFLEWVEQEKVDVIIPNCEDNILAAIPHLPLRVRYISICHNISRASYLLSRLYLERLSLIVAISERQVQDLGRSWGVPSAKLRLIPHGIEFEKFFHGHRLRSDSTNLRLVYVGRIDDMAKGVMWLPHVLEGISNQNVPFSLDIVGIGPDLAALRRRCQGFKWSGRVHFHGQLTPTEVPPILAQADIFLMPSRFEGFGLTLVEAMAAGCVPIATHLEGVTNRIVEDGVSGFLCPMGDTRAFAQKIIDLHHDRTRLAMMARAAQERVREKFSLERMATDYDALFTQVLSEPPVAYDPQPLERLEYPKELQPTWRTRVPLPVKNLARKVLYRCLGYIP